MRNLIIFMMAMISLSSFSQSGIKKAPGTSTVSKNKNKTMIVNFDQLQTIIKKNDNKLYVINFWATWCRPCVEELPEFMEVNKSYRNNPGFKMILVSLDMASEIDSKVKPFLSRHKMEADVYLLDDNKRMNEWIPAIDKSWTGAIPATVFYRNGKKLDFKESKIDKNELIKIINQYL